MLYFRVNSERIFIISEYWLLFTSILTIEAAIIVNIRKNRAQQNPELEELKKGFYSVESL